MNKNSFDYVGIANIYEKKECFIDGIFFVYYVKLGPEFGMYFDFTEGKNFIILSGDLSGISIEIGNEENYDFASFKTLNELCNENDKKYNYNKFMEDYSGNTVGKYFTYDKDRKHFSLIKDEELIEKINYSSKSHDIEKIYNSIRKAIIGQDLQIKDIISSLYKNQMVANSSIDDDIKSKLKENIVIFGSTGTGKSEIVKRFSSICDVPLVFQDAQNIDASKLFNNIYLKAGKDIKKAQKGIIVFDSLNVNNQKNLFDLLEEFDSSLKEQYFDTSLITFVLEYNIPSTATELSKKSELIEGNIISNLRNYFSKYVVLDNVTEEVIKKILLESSISPLVLYKTLFDSQGIKFNWDADFVNYVASKVSSLDNGAKMLNAVVDEELSPIMFEAFTGNVESINLMIPSCPDGHNYSLKMKKKL